MSAMDEFTKPPKDPLGRFLFFCSVAFAATGGLFLIALGGVTACHVVLRLLQIGSIRGEVEIVSLGVTAAVFLFLPYAQIVRGHVVADLLTSTAPARVRRILDSLSGLLMTLMLALLAWRLAVGAIDIAQTNEQTTILHLSYWWAFAVGVPSLVFACLNALYLLTRDIRRLQ